MKKNMVLSLKIIELLLCIMSFLTMTLLDFNNSNETVGLLYLANWRYVELIITSLLFICFIGECILKFAKIRLSFFTFYLLILLLLINEDEGTLNSLMFVMNIFYFFFVFLSLFCKDKNKKLPNNIFSKKHYEISYLIINFTIFFLVLVFYLYIEGYLNPFLYVLFNFALLFALIILLNKISPFSKALYYINRKLNYASYISKIDNLLENNLNDETRNYLLLVKANYLTAKNKEEALKLFEEVYKPKKRIYLNQYIIIKFNYFINKDDLESAKNYLQEINLSKINKTIKNNLAMSYKIATLEASFEEVIKANNTHTNIPFTNIVNEYTITEYCLKKDLKEEAKIHAKKILDYHSDLDTYNEFANAILKD